MEIRKRACRSALSGRRNGLVAFSTAIVDGIVGCPFSLSAATSAARALSAALFGSTVSAKRAFDCVYSWAQYTWSRGARADVSVRAVRGPARPSLCAREVEGGAACISQSPSSRPEAS